MDYIFGYGSIVDDASRLSTLSAIHPHLAAESDPALASSSDQFTGGALDAACAAKLSCLQGVFSMKRTWSFRSASGFTALGLSEIQEGDTDGKIFGVLFPVDSAQVLASFDLREKGYLRVMVPLAALEVDTSIGCATAQDRARSLGVKLRHAASRDRISPVELRVWTYIPDEAHALPPDEEHPILQTYLDVCLRGCLAWGGRPLALEFINSTSGWSPFYLNDAPMSRRPWLHRADYERVDECLQHLSAVCLFKERRHPEEFAAEHLSPIRGMWGVPPRNSQFVGRSAIIAELEQKLHLVNEGCTEFPGRTRENESDVMCPGSHQTAIVGLGGVGKTQTAVEFAHRQYLEGKFGLIIWLRATAAEEVAADLRRFAFDTGILKAAGTMSAESTNQNATWNIDFDDDQIADEIRRKLVRSRFKWLVVLDNVEDSSTLSMYSRFLQPQELTNEHASPLKETDAPLYCGGHILVTSRYLIPEWERGGNVVVLECFNTDESILYIQNSLGLPLNTTIQLRPVLQKQHMYLELAKRMGCLPLALSMAAAYMRRCDVDVTEYVRRLDDLDRKMKYSGPENSSIHGLTRSTSSTRIGVAKVNDSIVSSLTISLDRIRVESAVASKLVPCLGFLYPDNITKSFIEALVLSIDAKISIGLRLSKHLSQIETIVLGAVAQGSSCLLHTLIRDKSLLAAILRHFARRYYLGSLTGLVVAVSVALFFGADFLCTRNLCLGGIFGCFGLCYICIGFLGFLRVHDLYFTYELLGIYDVLMCPGSTSQRAKITWIEKWIPSFDASDIYPFSLYSRKPCTVSDLPTDLSEKISAERDSVWELMIQFSVMTVRGTRSMQRIGSIHRLQQNVIQSQCTQLQWARCLEHCIDACSRRWKFDSRNPDITAWDNCGQLLPHLEVLARYAMSFMDVAKKIKLLKDGGALVQAHMGVVIGHTDHENSFPRCAAFSCFVQTVMKDVIDMFIVSFFKKPNDKHESGYSEGEEAVSNSNTDDANPGPFCSRYIRWRYLFDLSELCMQAGLYASVVQSKFDSAQSFLDTALELVNYLGWALNTAPSSLKINFPSSELNLYVETSSAILYHLGKTLRYNGLFERANESLSLALEIRLRQSQVSPEVSDTLHELGVLHLKLHRLTEAEVLLTRSFRLKKQLRNIHSLQVAVGGAMGPNFLGDTSEASTLHQLGVVARAQRRYEDAEDLLNKSLQSASSEKTTYNTSSHTALTSRAATIQQLGRIALRRGQLEQAQKLFNEALELYEAAYGENHSTTHINTIAVRHQLGNTAVADRRFGKACEYYAACLTALETLYGDSADVWRRYDIVFELQALGQAYLSDKDNVMAESIFKRQIEVIKTILSAKYTYIVDRHKYNNVSSYHLDDDSIIIDGVLAAKVTDDYVDRTYLRRRSALVNSHLFAVHSLRNIEKQKNNGPGVARYAKEARHVKSIQKELLCDASNDTFFSRMYAVRLDDVEVVSGAFLCGAAPPPTDSNCIDVSLLSDPHGLFGNSTKALFKIQSKFRLAALPGSKNNNCNIYNQMLKLFTEVVSFRCSIRNKCVHFMKAAKSLTKGQFSLEIRRGFDGLDDCEEFSKRRYNLLRDMGDTLKEMLSASNADNGRELFEEIDLLLSAVRRFSDAQFSENIINLPQDSLLTEEFLKSPQFLEAIQTSLERVSVLFKLSDDLRVVLAKMGVSIEDTS